MSVLLLVGFYFMVMAFILGGCGGDGNGNEDTLLTGFSGFVILCIVIYVIYRVVKNRGGGK